MKEVVFKHTSLLKFDIFGAFHEVRHFVSTRKGGTSQGSCSGLNMGFGTNDEYENVLQNRQILSETLGVPLDWFVFPRQTHSANIVVVDKSMKGRGAISKNDSLPDTDALICNQPNIFIAVQAADCVPVLLLDPENSAIAAIHAGWRGTAQEIVAKTIDAMNTHFGTQAKEIIAGIGPSVGKCCYFVGQEVNDSFSKLHTIENIFESKGNQLYLDLWQANKKQLLTKGVLAQNIEVAEICTQCNSDLVFSHRQSKGNSGRFAAGIMLM